MNQFSASEAALEGFRLTRERPGTFLAWGVVYALGMFIIGRLMLVSLDPQLIALTRKSGFAAEDVEQISGLLAKSWPAFILVLVLVTALLSMLMGGIYRLVLRPQEKGVLHLRFGKDELRLTGVNLLLFAFGMICLTAELAAITAAEQTGGLGFVVVFVLGAVTVWLGVRLSLATPMTFAQHRFAIGDAWRATRGRFWPMFGMILLAVIFYIMVWLLISIIGAALVAVAGGPEALKDIKQAAGPAIVVIAIYVFLQLVLQVIQIVMIYAPFAVAYQQLHGDTPANPLRAHVQNG